MSAIQQLITDHIAIWTAADTEKKSGRGRSADNGNSVYGVKKLRELILELAVRGKLVPQDPKDEPASELLKKIQAEKSKLIADGKLRKSQPLPLVSEEEKPFELPDGWMWVRLGQLGDWGAGATPLRSVSSYYGGEMPWFKSGELSADFIDSSEETITELALKECSLRLNQPGDVLIAMYGATIGKAAILKVAGTTNQAVCACTPFSGILNRYLLTLLKAMRSNFIGQGAGGAQPNISREKIIATVVAYPPEAEQHRIVAKVDELMALCDQLETQHNNAAEAHEKLVTQLLATLTQSQNAGEFSENWQRIAAHFDTLFTAEASIDALKQTLLQLAVMGKLVPQDPKDEPASELLKKIQTEKAKLIAEGKIKKEKPLPPISDGEKPFVLPAGWFWVKFPEVYFFQEGPGIRNWQFRERGIKLLNVQNIVNDSLVLDNTDKHIEIDEYEKKYRHFTIEENDLLFASSGGSWGKTAFFKDPGYKVIVNTSTVRMRPLFDLCSRFFMRDFIKTQFFKDQMVAQLVGIQPNFGSTHLSKIVLPLPPLAEQHRIVAKVDELMTLCEKLKSRITEANRLQQKLADAVVEQALNSANQEVEIAVPNRNEARALLGAEIIHQLHSEKTFGQVKLQKIVHLCEYFADLETVAGEYKRYAAGPHDPELISDIESSVQQNEWYEEFQRDKFGHAYRPLSHAGEHRKKMGDYWQAKLPIIQKLIDAMRKWDTERCEIFSTLYAAWNDLLIFGKPVSDEAILSEVLERWHDSKTKITQKSWLEGLEWMRKEGFIPKGTGRATRVEGLFD
ncbi:MAG: restriction endonuclease subunit S [Spongiibacteraceae bacterium]